MKRNKMTDKAIVDRLLEFKPLVPWPGWKELQKQIKEARHDA